MKLSLIRSLLLLSGLSCSPAFAQGTLNVDGLRQQLVGKQYILRNYSADPELAAAWNGSTLTLREPLLHAFAQVTVKDVSADKHRILINGERTILIRVGRTKEIALVNKAVPVSILIEWNSSDDPTAALEKALFFSSTQEAIDSIPSRLGNVISAWDEGSSSYIDCVACTSLRTLPAQPDQETFNPSMGVTPPRLRKQVQPRNLKGWPVGDFDVLLHIIITEQGKPDPLWLLRTSGFEFDEAAAEAVSKYRFDPAKKNGVPVPVLVNIDVHFAIRP